MGFKLTPDPTEENAKQAQAQLHINSASKQKLSQTESSVQKHLQIEEMMLQRFAAFDTDESGLVDLKEIEFLLMAAKPEAPRGVLKQVLASLVKAGDNNRDGMLTFEEFAVVHNELLDLTQRQVQLDLSSGDAETVQLTLRHLVFPQFHSLRDIFQTMDQDGSGAISIAEFSSICHLFGFRLSPQEVFQLSKKYDSNGDGRITYDEFLSGLTDLAPSEFEEKAGREREAIAGDVGAIEEILRKRVQKKFYLVKSAFQQADADRSGYLNAEEFSSIMRSFGYELPEVSMQALVGRNDDDLSRGIDYEEFCKMLWPTYKK